MEPIEVREFRNRIGKAIRRFRDEEGISSRFLAKVLGVTQATISRIENGTTSISADKLCFLAKSFNRPLSYFVGERSPLLYDEGDVLRAGLVFYGASQLKSKRTIDIHQHYRTYAEFLNSALTEVDEARFAAALATTLYNQAAKNKLKVAQIISTVQHERLIINLKALIKLICDARFYVKRPSKEKERTLRRLEGLSEELLRGQDIDYLKSTVANINSIDVAKFINASIGYE